jgi:small subunit ribosomal protein S21
MYSIGNPVRIDGISVVHRESESIDSMLKRFKKKVVKSEILKEYRDKSEYLKPSEAKRKKRMDARRRAAKEQLKQEKQIIKKRKTNRRPEGSTHEVHSGS